LKLNKNNKAKKATPTIFSEFLEKKCLLNFSAVAGPLRMLTNLPNFLREVLFIDKGLISKDPSMNFQNHLHP
jgi:hypothetical protein